MQCAMYLLSLFNHSIPTFAHPCILQCFSFCVRRVKEFKVLKCLVNIFVQFVIEKCVLQSIQ